jgi:hypothetical protein
MTRTESDTVRRTAETPLADDKVIDRERRGQISGEPTLSDSIFGSVCRSSRLPHRAPDQLATSRRARRCDRVACVIDDHDLEGGVRCDHRMPNLTASLLIRSCPDYNN